MQRYFAQDKKNEVFHLSNDDIHHIRTVMRMKQDDLVEVIYQKKLYLCRLDIFGKEISVHLQEEKEVETSPNVEIVLIIPFLKEQKMDLILQKGTELGVSKFILIDTERSIVKLDSKKSEAKLNRWSKICKEASEQSLRLDIPLVIIEREKDNLERLVGLKLLCSTTEKEQTIKKALKKAAKCDKINLMIGPEGGFSLEEEIYFEKKGFNKVSLGARIMRAETVPIFLSSIISYEYME